MPHDGWHPHDSHEPGHHEHGHDHHDNHGPPTRRVVLAATLLAVRRRQRADRRRLPAHRRAGQPLPRPPRRRPAAAGADRLRVRQPARLALHPAQPLGPHPGRDEAGPGRRGAGAVRHGAERARAETARRRAPPRRRVARAAGKLPRSRPLLRLGLRHARPLPVGLALRGPSPVAERGAGQRRPRLGDAVLRRRPSRHGARRPEQGFQAARRVGGSRAPDHGRPHRTAAAHCPHRRSLVRRDRRQPAARDAISASRAGWNSPPWTARRVSASRR